MRRPRVNLITMTKRIKLTALILALFFAVATFAACGGKPCEMTIKPKPDGAIDFIVKDGNITIKTGDTIDSGTKLTISWRHNSKHEFEGLYINGKLQRNPSNPFTMRVRKDTTIEVKIKCLHG